MLRMLLKQCPRCGGDLQLEAAFDREDWSCIQCGHAAEALDEPPSVKETPRTVVTKRRISVAHGSGHSGLSAARRERERSRRAPSVVPR
jgi:ribosomal protein S27AE